MAAENRWGRSALGWTTGKVGTGVLAFAPSLALDICKNIRFDMNASGLSRLAGFDAHAFAVDSAKSQSGNAAGLAASAGAGLVLGGLGVAGAPLILAGLFAGIVVQLVWNGTGLADSTSQLAARALR